MSGTLSKIIQGFSILLISICVILTVVFYVQSLNVPAEATVEEQMDMMGSSLELFINWAYVLFGIAAVSAILFPIANAIFNPKGATKGLIGLVIVGVVVLISYNMADSIPMNIPGYTGAENTPDKVKLTGTLLNTTYIFFILAVLSIIYSNIARIFK